MNTILKKLNMRFSVVVLSLIILVVSAYGQIKVSYVGGEAYFTRDGSRQRVTYGMEVRPGDLITTSSRSFVALLFDDGSIHKVTANTQYQIQKYQNNENSRFQVFNIIKGKIFSFVSKTFKKSDIKFLTPTAVVGVRGTSFITEVNNEGTTVYMIEGRVDFSSTASGNAIPLGKGEKGKATGDKIDKQPMQQQDYQEATKNIPVSLAEVELETTTTDEDEESAGVNAEKELARSFVDESVERIDEQRDEINNNRIWDHQSSKVVDGKRISQVVKQSAPNRISIVNHTYDSVTGSQNSLDLRITFKEKIPNLEDALSGITRDAEKFDWKISVMVNDKKDELNYSLNYPKDEDKVELVDFNGNVGQDLESKNLVIEGANIKAPTFISFKIDGEVYQFDLDYRYINDSATVSKPVTTKFDSKSGSDLYNNVLFGDYNTRIQIKAIMLGGKNTKSTGAMEEYSKNNKVYTIILLNGYLVPLFNNSAL